MQLVSFLFFQLFIVIIGILPFKVVYLLSDFTNWVLRVLIKYRKKVIQENLGMAFPDLNQEELKKLTYTTYRNLSDIFVESIKSFTMSKSTIVKRYKIVNPEVLAPYAEKGQSLIGVTGHYGNWEWGSLAASLQTSFEYVAFYKPLRNKYIGRFLKKSRSKCGTELVSIYETSKTFEDKKEETKMYLMVADQSPSKKQLKYAYWMNFLGKETAFLHGVEKHARNNNYPVLYVDIQRVKRGYYEVTISPLVESPNELRDEELTQKYAEKLESVIRKQPENWLWSHNRWKHQKQ